MLRSELDLVEQQLQIKLPEFYIRTMLDHPFAESSFATELSLCNDVETIFDVNSVLEPGEEKFAVGSDGGEFIFYIRLNGEDKVYIFDFERSKVHNSVAYGSWDEYLKDLSSDEERYRQEELLEEERKRNKKWWQFWI